MSKGAPLAETVKALQEIDRVIDLIECPGSSAAQNIAVVKLIWSEVKRARAALDRLEPDPATARYIRAGKLLHDKAKSHGWLDDGEGAYEFMSRLTYAQGMEDAKGIRALKEQP